MFCTQCGQKLLEAARFCTSCGAQVDSATQMAAEPSGRPSSSNLPPEQQELLSQAEEGDEDAMFHFAVWCMSEGELATAEFWLKKLVDLGDFFAAYELGRVYEGEDDHEAERLFLLAFENLNEAYVAEKLGYHYAQRGKNADAKKWYLTALEMAQGSSSAPYTPDEMADVYRLLALACRELGETGEAEGWFQKSAEMGNVQSMVQLGLLLESQGEWDRAHSWLKKSADTGHTHGVFFLGWFYEDAGQLEDAKSCYQAAAEGDHPDACHRLGLLYRAEGNISEAERWLRRASDLGQEDAQKALDTGTDAEGSVSVGVVSVESRDERGGPPPPVVIKTHGFKFSAEQLSEVEETAIELASLVTEFGLSNKRIPRQEAQEFAAREPNRIFSLLHETGSGLFPGFLDNCDDYYVSRVPFATRPSPYPYTEVYFFCVVCDGEGVVGEAEEQCPNCEDGSLLFDLDWDENGVVTAHNTLPPQ